MNSSMVKALFCGLIFGMLSGAALAAMEPMSADDMSNTTAQSGAEISLNMRLNLDENNKYKCAGQDKFCRIAIAANNRKNEDNKTKWIVLKGVHGQIHVQQLFMEGATNIETVNKSGDTVIKNGLKFTYNHEKPILIRNFGYEAISAEDDDATSRGFLKTETYTQPGFDQGRETGFLGMQIDANLQIGGTVKIFGIDK